MKNVMTAAVLVVGAMATAAGAQTATFTEIGQMAQGGYSNRLATSYTGIPGPYSAFTAATGNAGFDDYGTSITDSSFALASMRFVGGVTSIGGTMQFRFYDSTATLFSSASVNLPSAGDFIWTITFGTLPDGSDSTFQVPNNGFLELVVGANTTGRWFMTTTGPTVGTNNIAVGTGSTLNPQRYNAFELIAVPAPASLALLGLGGLVATRRRR
jgi:hypothetical protein